VPDIPRKHHHFGLAINEPAVAYLGQVWLVMIENEQLTHKRPGSFPAGIYEPTVAKPKLGAMSIVFGVLCLLAAAAWLSYAYRQDRVLLLWLLGFLGLIAVAFAVWLAVLLSCYSRIPVLAAAEQGDLHAVKKLLEQGHSINERDPMLKCGWTPLMSAISGGW
jgi:hypothetical protein